MIFFFRGWVAILVFGGAAMAVGPLELWADEPALAAVELPAAATGAAELAEADAAIDEQDRSHWAFQPVRRPDLPTVKNADWVRNPIDAFVLARLETAGWSPAAGAAPRALLRRMYLGLTGLPPTLDEQTAMPAQPTPEFFDEVARQLLARPSYGERWGRHWLDLVRYAETNGYERDGDKPYVWRYRDYVIRSLNNDKPYDRFILEQLAGDELDDASAETMIATGYYRLGPWDDEPADFQEDRFDQLDDMLNTTSQVFLGLTLACARCHDHKFEPLTQHDYYRLIAVFNTLTRPQQGRSDLDVPAGSREQLAALEARDRRVSEIQQQIDAVRGELREKFLKEPAPIAGSTGLSAEVWAAFRVPADQRTEAQKKLVELHARQLDGELLAAADAGVRTQVTEWEAQIRQLREETPDLLRGYFMVEKSTPPATHLLIRGKAASPGPEVLPGLPAVLVRTQPQFPAAGGPTSGRRLALARWIASSDNPLTARVIVNRVWQFHFGTGLVRSPSDFGVMGQNPTHPELLDWLADWFVQEGGWSIKRLHELILASNTYRMGRQGHAEYAAKDPENQRLWRNPYRRLEVEAIRDSMLAVSGRLNRQMYGPAMYPYVPPEAMAGHSDPDKIWPPFNEAEASRRTVYAFVKRSLVVPFLEVLDLCDTTKTSAQRNVTSVAPQALTLFNGEFVNRQARYFAARLVNEVGDDPGRQIERAYQLALCRAPTDTERQSLLVFLNDESAQLIGEQSGGEILDPISARRLALERVCRVIFNLNEFVYPD